MAGFSAALALEIALTLGIRTTVGLLPAPIHDLIAPVQEALVPAPRAGGGHAGGGAQAAESARRRTAGGSPGARGPRFRGPVAAFRFRPPRPCRFRWWSRR